MFTKLQLKAFLDATALSIKPVSYKKTEVTSMHI